MVLIMLNDHRIVYYGFIVLPVVMAVAVAWASGSRRLAFAILMWMLTAAALAHAGVLRHFNALPPPMGLFIFSGLIATVVIGRSNWVQRLVEMPMAVLIGAQSFRIVVEILLHQSSELGLAPPQMTWSGCNFDVITGVTALLLAPFARVVSPRWIFLWNCMGLLLLTVVVSIAIVSFPTPFQKMRPDNTWVADFPYVWLPAILVTTALLGHIILFRKLAAKSDQTSSAG